MVAKAAVKIRLCKDGREVCIPCHRHVDAYEILHELGYKAKDYDLIEEGFLNEDDVFMSRTLAYLEARGCNQITYPYKETEAKIKPLYSEDVW